MKLFSHMWQRVISPHDSFPVSCVYLSTSSSHSPDCVQTLLSSSQFVCLHVNESSLLLSLLFVAIVLPLQAFSPLPFTCPGKPPFSHIRSASVRPSFVRTTLEKPKSERIKSLLGESKAIYDNVWWCIFFPQLPLEALRWKHAVSHCTQSTLDCT